MKPTYSCLDVRKTERGQYNFLRNIQCLWINAVESKDFELKIIISRLIPGWKKCSTWKIQEFKIICELKEVKLDVTILCLWQLNTESNHSKKIRFTQLDLKVNWRPCENQEMKTKKQNKCWSTGFFTQI